MKCSLGNIPRNVDELIRAEDIMKRTYMGTAWEDVVSASFQDYVDHRDRNVISIKGEADAMAVVIKELNAYDADRDINRAREICSRADSFL